MSDKTSVFNVNILKQELLMMYLNEIINTLEKNGYNPTNQLVGYLLTGDLSYITSKDDARNKISRYSREELLMTIINGYLGR